MNLKTYTLDEIQDEFIGPKGTAAREAYEYELRMDLLGEAIKAARKKRGLTQRELGDLVGVQKAQISKLEHSAKNVTLNTLLKVFQALKAEIDFHVKLDGLALQVR